MPDEFVGFPSMAQDERWPGAWRFGPDWSGDSRRVIAVHIGGGDIKYGLHWKGPVVLNNETATILEAWAEEYTSAWGGYVHLFPADGDTTEELRDWAREWLEDEEQQEANHG